jgi:hypothetical protein
VRAWSSLTLSGRSTMRCWQSICCKDLPNERDVGSGEFILQKPVTAQGFGKILCDFVEVSSPRIHIRPKNKGMRPSSPPIRYLLSGLLLLLALRSPATFITLSLRNSPLYAQYSMRDLVIGDMQRP